MIAKGEFDMKRINLTKYGFVKSSVEDFSDDGTRFHVYRVGIMKVTSASYRDKTFISARADYCPGVGYDVYSKLPRFDDLDKLNGVKTDSITDKDLIDLYDACIVYGKEYVSAIR